MSRARNGGRLRIVIEFDADETAVIGAIMGATNAGSPDNVVRTALWRHAKHLGIATLPDAFANWRSAGEKQARNVQAKASSSPV